MACCETLPEVNTMLGRSDLWGGRMGQGKQGGERLKAAWGGVGGAGRGEQEGAGGGGRGEGGGAERQAYSCWSVDVLQCTASSLNQCTSSVR